MKKWGLSPYLKIRGKWDKPHLILNNLKTF